ncbi:hypothetical protein [uncultured Mediterranean phage uvMED]|nr:hypothetical protein [uncultured Mediterranean phage uvMED]
MRRLNYIKEAGFDEFKSRFDELDDYQKKIIIKNYSDLKETILNWTARSENNVEIKFGGGFNLGNDIIDDSIAEGK